MKEVEKSLTIVDSILKPQKLRLDTFYKWSIYTYLYCLNSHVYLYNTLTRQCCRLNKEEYELYCSLKHSEIAASEVEKNELLFALMKGHFLVPTQRDEVETYESLVDVIAELESKTGIVYYTLLPTTACNARCFYCYEEGVKPESMSDETIEQVISFIERTKRDGKIIVNLFGGEPLLGTSAIDRVLEGLRKKQVEFETYITTNGYLFTKSMADHIINDWNCTFIQFSLDGNEEEYNRRKNYVNSSSSAYKTVLNNIQFAYEKKIKTNLRCNIDYQNCDGLEEFIADIVKAVPPTKKVTITFAPLYDLQVREQGCADLWDRCRDLHNMIRDIGYAEPIFLNLRKMKVFSCMAHDVRGSAVIMPSGQLYACEHIIPGTSTGDIVNGLCNEQIVNSLETREKATGPCRSCVFIPFCTTFRQCPVQKTDCEHVMKNHLDSALRERILEAEASAVN